jgi:hypothetical protein
LVEDLGTEFGVEVAASGETASHVFQGQVRLMVAGTGDINPESPHPRTPNPEIVLSAGQSATIAGGKIVSQGDSKIKAGGDAAGFIRKMPLPVRLGELDLLDIVAGGDGTGRSRGAGIDPADGAKVNELVPSNPLQSKSYNRVAWNRLIDGVFIPDGKTGAVQLDSAGNTFTAFPATSAMTYSPVWARAADVARDEQLRYKEFWMYHGQADGWDAPRRRSGLLAMHANVGLTFDLAALREVHPGVVRPLKFAAAVEMTHEKGQADVWVFVDGKEKFRRDALRQSDGAVRVEVKLAAEVRFLTLVVTDGAEPTRDQYDWVVFADPVLQAAMQKIEESNPIIRNQKEEIRTTR